jgi:hypothetical protein
MWAPFWPAVYETASLPYELHQLTLVGDDSDVCALNH